MMRFASASECRMAALIRHFGDRNDSVRTCGLCDFCSPERAVAGAFRDATADEERLLQRIIAELERYGQGRSSGKLYEAVDPKSHTDRRDFDALLDALSRAGYLTIESASFTPADGSGREIAYRKVMLTHEGRAVNAGEAMAGVQVREAMGEAAAKSRKSARKPSSPSEMEPLTPQQKQTDAALRGWRRQTAADLKQPAFCVFGDRVLRAIAVEEPRTQADLLNIHGLGRAKVDRWGEAILAVLHETQGANASVPPHQAQTRDNPSRSEAKDSRSARNGGDTAKQAKPVALKPPNSSTQVAPKPAPGSHAGEIVSLEGTSTALQLDRALKIWRMHEAKRLGVAPFVLLLDQSIRGIIAAEPRSAEALRNVDGLSPKWVEQHGSAVVGVVTPFLSAAR